MSTAVINEIVEKYALLTPVERRKFREILEEQIRKDEEDKKENLASPEVNDL